MAITLGTNIPAFISRMYLNSANSSLTTTMERLSSGKKINNAGDDAAGLVISENMSALVRGSKQAMANIQNAESFLTVAEDGMVAISDHLQRVNDLLVNMANDTNDVESRTAAVREIIERIDEINRLADSTNFNGRNMLDGSVDKIIVQMGPDSTETSILDISSALTDCHTEALDVDLPAVLNPDALIYNDGTDKIAIPNPDGAGYVDSETGDPVAQITDPNDHDSAFDASNENCRAYMEKIQAAISKLSTNRGLLGAYENRMESSYDSLSTRIESLESAKSLYVDTDIAEESTNFAQQQIMQQINISILSSANSMQQNALALLGG